MQISVGKLAPPAAVLAVVAYGVWPTVAGALWPPSPPAAEHPTEMSALLLSPKLPPPPVRNPFTGKPIAARRAAPETLAKAASKRKGRTVQDALRAARQAADGKVAVARASAKAREFLRGFTLQATSVASDQRMAVINDRLYSVGDALRVGRPDAVAPAKPHAAESAPPAARLPPGLPGEPAAAAASNAPPSGAPADPALVACRIVDVLPDRVLLELDGTRVELQFSDASGRSAPSRGGIAKRGTGKKSGAKGGKGKGKK
jgi:hypothetical protein